MCQCGGRPCRPQRDSNWLKLNLTFPRLHRASGSQNDIINGSFVMQHNITNHHKPLSITAAQWVEARCMSVYRSVLWREIKSKLKGLCHADLVTQRCIRISFYPPLPRRFTCSPRGGEKKSLQSLLSISILKFLRFFAAQVKGALFFYPSKTCKCSPPLSLSFTFISVN